MSLPPLKPTPRELQFIKDNSQRMTTKELGTAIGRSHMLVRRWMLDNNIAYKKPAAPKTKGKSGYMGWGKGVDLQSVWR